MLKVNRHAMPEQPADVRRHNFEEVALGYDEATAIEEAKRCLNCPKPRCVEGCPVNIYIPKFVHAVSEGDFASAIKILLSVAGSAPRKSSAKAAAYWASKGNR